MLCRICETPGTEFGFCNDCADELQKYIEIRSPDSILQAIREIRANRDLDGTREAATRQLEPVSRR